MSIVFPLIPSRIGIFFYTHRMYRIVRIHIRSKYTKSKVLSSFSSYTKTSSCVINTFTSNFFSLSYKKPAGSKSICLNCFLVNFLVRENSVGFVRIVSIFVSRFGCSLLTMQNSSSNTLSTGLTFCTTFL